MPRSGFICAFAFILQLNDDLELNKVTGRDSEQTPAPRQDRVTFEYAGLAIRYG